MRVTIARAEPADRWDILDFANFVFSQAHVPHDFRRLLPKMYADDVDFTPCHYLAKEDGRIVGLVSALVYDMVYGEHRLKTGFVGTVSTHPYRRGAGYMKACMALMHEDMAKKGVQLLVLGGQRQRYGHYGYSVGCPAVRHHISRANVDKALGSVNASDIRFTEETDGKEASRLHMTREYRCERDPARYLAYVRSWNRAFYRIGEGDKCLGFCAQGLSDIELYDPNDLLRVVKAYVSAFGDVDITMGIACPRENETLFSLAEHSAIINRDMVRPIDWPACAEFFLKVRAGCISPLQDGLFRLGVEGVGTLEMRVEGGIPACRLTDAAPDAAMSPTAAQELLFSTQSLFLPRGIRNWLPLPCWVPDQDGY